MRRFTSLVCVTGSKPHNRTRPPSGARNPSMISTVVVLPAPFGPSRPKTSPRLEAQAAHRLHLAITFAQVFDNDRGVIGGADRLHDWFSRLNCCCIHSWFLLQLPGVTTSASC